MEHKIKEKYGSKSHAFLLSDNLMELSEELVLDPERDFLFLSDTKTYEVYQVVGADPPHGEKNKAGQKCYEILYGSDTPCDDCNIGSLYDDSYLIRNITDAGSIHKYIAEGKLVEWNGKTVHMELVRDITEPGRAEHILKLMIEDHDVLMNCLRVLAQESDTLKALENCMAYIGNFYCADAACIYFFDREKKDIGWSRKENSSFVFADYFHDRDEWADLFSWVGQLYVRDADELKVDSPTEYEIFKNRNVTSCCVTPIFIDKRLEGIVCMNNMGDHTGGISLLRTVCMYLGERLHREETERKAQSMMYADPVTGFGNFYRFRLRANELISTYGQRKWALLSCDLRHMKYVNDVFGFTAGDRLMRYWSEIIASEIKGDEDFARLSADNFVVLLHYENSSEIEDWFCRVAEKLAEYSELSCKNFNTQMVAGVYLRNLKLEDADLDGMIERANMARMHIKRARGSYAFYNQKMREAVYREIEMENDFARAIKDEEFVLYFQPKLPLSRESDDAIYAEALVRWRRPDGSVMLPNDFIPLLERDGGIVKLDLYVFKKVCDFMCSVRDMTQRRVNMSLNVSRISAFQPDFVARYCAVKESYGIEDYVVELEFTESVVAENYVVFRKIIRSLQKNGFLCAIDDFGSGYSSLNVLKELPFDVLKLDRMFFQSKDFPKRGAAIVESVMQLAQQLHIRTVAEGVEQNKQVELLRYLGCNYLQGYIYSRPIPEDVFVRDFINKEIILNQNVEI